MYRCIKISTDLILQNDFFNFARIQVAPKNKAGRLQGRKPVWRGLPKTWVTTLTLANNQGGSIENRVHAPNNKYNKELYQQSLTMTYQVYPRS